MSLNKQQKIVNWFDITYKRKGFSYLRTSEAYEVFTKILNLKSGDSVLDVACGPGLFLRLANEIDCRCTGIDASKEAVKMARNYTPESEIYLGNSEKFILSQFHRSSWGHSGRVFKSSKLSSKVERYSALWSITMFGNYNFCNVLWIWFVGVFVFILSAFIR